MALVAVGSKSGLSRSSTTTWALAFVGSKSTVSMSATTGALAFVGSKSTVSMSATSMLQGSFRAQRSARFEAQLIKRDFQSDL